MTLNDVVKRIKDRSHMGDVSITTDSTTEQIIRAVNDCRRVLVRRLPKEYLRKTGTIAVVQGTTDYSLASDVQEPIIFRYTSSNSEYILQQIASERQFYQEIYSANAAQSKPQYYVEIGRDTSGYRQIKLSPTPDASYTVNYAYFKDPTITELTTSDLSTAFPDVPSYLQDALVSGALWLFLKNFDDLAASDRAKQDFAQALIEADIAQNEDQDSENAFSFGINSNPYLSDNGIKLI